MIRANNRTTRLVTAALLASCAGAALAQAPGGLVGQAVTRLEAFDGATPGFLYYGVNGADRGLGYVGSYMTLGGFVPYAEDDLGGFWAADLRGHLSTNGGFFSNVGAVRKQFIGGTLLGVGVYWDYDGDMNQYPTWDTLGTAQFGQFGHVYNQVGVSGEWLTDYGNIRSNGYIPVGTSAHTLGAPGDLFTGNFLLCDYGLDAALGGADLEVGAYIPGLADWAGMISVGGYALGNTRYDWWQGTQAGQGVVPWFGGVYTRLDMTFLKNWDFSLQANNDSHFDWTGFARLTYRMGGSRRRNVPDQVEQPMMRNEHIVRSHQTPIVALNPVDGTPWNVIHVDNTAVVGGNGTAETPVQTLAQAQALAVNPYDIVYVHTGSSATSPYVANWQFQADNQILVGQGSTLSLATLNCGYEQFFQGAGPSTAYPVLASSGTAIELRNGAVVDHFQISTTPFVTTPVAIAAGPALTGTANVNDVRVIGTIGTGQVGVQLSGVPAGGQVNLYNMLVQNTDWGLFIDGGAADVTFQGLIQHANSPQPALVVQNTTGGTINVNRTADSLETAVARNGQFVQSYGIIDAGSQAAAATAPIALTFNSDTAINVGQTRITDPLNRGVLVQGGTKTAVSFNSLVVQNANAQAFYTESNDADSSIIIDGFSTLSSVSTTLAAFQSNTDAARLAVTLAELRSGVTQNTQSAIIINGASTGFLTITDLFLVNGTPGTISPPAPPPGDVQLSGGTTVGVTVP